MSWSFIILFPVWFHDCAGSSLLCDLILQKVYQLSIDWCCIPMIIGKRLNIFFTLKTCTYTSTPRPFLPSTPVQVYGLTNPCKPIPDNLLTGFLRISHFCRVCASSSLAQQKRARFREVCEDSGKTHFSGCSNIQRLPSLKSLKAWDIQACNKAWHVKLICLFVWKLGTHPTGGFCYHFATCFTLQVFLDLMHCKYSWFSCRSRSI